jgi:hypothetical protein
MWRGVCQVVFAQAAVLLSYVSGKQARFRVINFIKIVMMRRGVRVSCVPFCARARRATPLLLDFACTYAFKTSAGMHAGCRERLKMK